MQSVEFESTFIKLVTMSADLKKHLDENFATVKDEVAKGAHVKASILKKPDHMLLCINEAKEENAFAVVSEREHINEIDEIIKAGSYEIEVKNVNLKKVISEIHKISLSTEETKMSEGELEANIARCRVFVPDLDERIKYMRDYEFGDILINSILSSYEENGNGKRPVHLYISSKDENGEHIIKNICEDIDVGWAVLIEGQKSVGKSVLIETVAWLFNLEVTVFRCSNDSTKDDVLGGMSTDNSVNELSVEEAESFIKSLSNIAGEDDLKKASNFIIGMSKSSSTHLKFELASLGRVLEKGKGVFVFDEMNMSNPNFLSSIANTLADDHTTEFEIPGYGIVPITKNIKIFGTQNPPGYAGTQAENEATVSRFQKYILVGDTSIKNILSAHNPKAVPKVIDILDNIFIRFKAEANVTIGEEALNIRGFKRALDSIVNGRNLRSALQISVLNACPEEDQEVLLQIVEVEYAKLGS